MKEKNFKKKIKLLDIALDEFIANGYDDASLNNILKNTGISKGTFYYHFKNKQNFYLYLLDIAVNEKIGFMNEYILSHEDYFAGKDIFELFKLKARVVLEFAAAFPKYYRLQLKFLQDKNKDIYEIAKTKIGESTDFFIEQMIKEAIKNEEFSDDFDEGFILKIFNHLLANFITIFCKDEKDFKIDKILKNLDDLINFVKNGLGRKSERIAKETAHSPPRDL